MNKKAFTLVELIATIVIISILALVATVSISSIIKKANERAYKEIESAMKTAAQNYVLKGNDIGIITSETLINGGFLEKPIDPKIKKACSVKKSYVNVLKEEVSGTINDSYNYNVCLICGDYKSEYCKDKVNIELSYQDIDKNDNTYIKMNNNESIDMEKLLGIKVKYETKFEVSGNIKFDFIDSDNNCKKAYAIEKLKNDYFAIFKNSNIETSCQVKVWDDSDESALAPSYFTIKNNNNGNDSNSLKLYVGRNYYIETSEKIYTSNIINFEKKLIEKPFKFRIEDDKKKIITEKTEGLKYELINNKTSSNQKCFELIGDSEYIDTAVSGNIQTYSGETNNSTIWVQYINDGCENVKLRVLDLDGNRIKDYLLEYLDLKHINYLSISKKYIEVNGRYNAGIAESYYSQKINFEPLDSDFKTAIKCGCLIKKGDNEIIDPNCVDQPATCSITTEDTEKYLLVKGGSRPTLNGETVSMILYVDDENSKVEPIKLKVKVNNVLPTDFSVKYSTTRDKESVPHICSGDQNYITVSLAPANAFGYISYVSFNNSKDINASISSKTALGIRFSVKRLSLEYADSITTLGFTIYVDNSDMKASIGKTGYASLYPDGHVAGGVTTGCNGETIDTRRYYCP